MKLISKKKTELLEIDGLPTPVRIRAGQVLTNVLEFDFNRAITYPSVNFRRHIERVLRELWNDALAVSPLFLLLIWKYLDDAYTLGDETGVWGHCPVPIPGNKTSFPGKAFAGFFDKFATIPEMESLYLQVFARFFNVCMARLQIMQGHFRQAASLCLDENNEIFENTGYTVPQRYALYCQFHGDDEPISAVKRYGWCEATQSDLIYEANKFSRSLKSTDDEAGIITVNSFSEFVRLSETPEVKISVCHTVDNIIGICCAQFSQLVRNNILLPLSPPKASESSAPTETKVTTKVSDNYFPEISYSDSAAQATILPFPMERIRPCGIISAPAQLIRFNHERKISYG